MLARLTATSLVLCFGVSAAAAQFAPPTDDIRNSPAVSVSVSYVSFEHDRSTNGQVPVLYEGALVGLSMTSPNHVLAVNYGFKPASAGQSRGSSMLDVTAMLWGRWSPLEALADGATRAYIPIGLYLNYREVQGPVEAGAQEDRTLRILEFDTFSIGLGAGLGLEHQFSDRVLIRGRGIPVIGVAERQLIGGGFLSDPTYLIDSDVALHIGNLTRGLGLTLGYGFRAQVWRMGSVPFFEPDEDDTVVYSGGHHHVRLGINW